MAEHELNHTPWGAFARVKQTENLAVLGLLLLLLSAAVAGITIALVNQDWLTLWRTLLFGLLLGWLLAIFRKPIWVITLTALAVGVLYILLFPGGMIGKVVDTAFELGHLLPGFWNSFRGRDVDLAPLARLSQDLFASAWTIIARVQAWVAAFASGQPTFDPVAASLAWNALVWLVATWAGWVVEARRNALLAALPAILLSLETLAYGRRTSFVIYLMLGSLLLLLAVVQQGHRRQSWDEASIAYPSRKGRQITNAALLITIVLVLFSAFASSTSIHRIQEWITEHRRPSTQQDSQLAKSLGLAPGGTITPDAFTSVRSPGLPEDHLIGSGPELSQRVVMTVSVQNLAALPRGRQTLPLYWRAFTYDIYTGDGWRSSTTEQSLYKANQPLHTDRAPGHILIQQQVYPVEDLGGIVYAAGEPLTVNYGAEVARRSNADLFGVRLDRAVVYGVDSLVPLVAEHTLRAAGQKYPDWVRQRYLDLPAEVPDRVRALAIELTASERTPYDRARAIESYLRAFTYTLDVSRPPVGRDVVDYFLFDLRMGYCDYYASSMVVLARAAGIPARLVIGYANGTYNLNSKRFVVTEADAHSWVEIYFPDIGWVTFEPTASRPPLQREEVLTDTQPQEFTPSVTPQAVARLQVWRFLLVGFVLAGLMGIVWVVLQEIRLNHLLEQAVAVEVYWRIRRFGKSLDVALELSNTPYEFTAVLKDRLQKLALQNIEPVFMPRLIRDLRLISDGIVHAIYSPSPPKTARDSSVLHQWRSLRWKLWMIWILKQWGSLTSHLERRTGRDNAGIKQENLSI
jgi:transglutaminase-like putative cysteine protease